MPNRKRGWSKQKNHREVRAALRAKRLAAEGGLVDRPIRGKVACIKIDTDKITKADLAPSLFKLQTLLRVAIEVIVKGEEAKHSVGAYVLLAEQGDQAPALLCAPEDFWATVNVSRLREGNPDAETLKTRIIKEMWRAFAYALGVGNSQQQPCLMRPIRKPADLDADKVSVVCPEALMPIKKTITAIGLAAGGQTTYRKACEEGWAAAPTNDVQRAVWEKVHEIPSEPIKIEKK